MARSILIVDDEAPARRKLHRFVDELSDWQVVAEARSVRTAVDAITSSRPDLVLLDIHLGDGSGFEVIAQIGSQCMPQVIFVTAYDQYALQAFEVHAVDYLLKPVQKERFAECVRRVARQSPAASDQLARMERLLAEMQRPERPDRIYVEHNDRGRFIGLDAVSHVASDRNYVEVVSREGRFRQRGSLHEIAARLDPSRFVQVNRSTIVNLDQIAEIQSWFRGDRLLILCDGSQIKLSKAYLQRSALLSRLLP